MASSRLPCATSARTLAKAARTHRQRPAARTTRGPTCPAHVAASAPAAGPPSLQTGSATRGSDARPSTSAAVDVAPPTATARPAAALSVAQRLPRESERVRRRPLGRGGRRAARSMQNEVKREVERGSVEGACGGEKRVGMEGTHLERRLEEEESRRSHGDVERRRCGYLWGQGGHSKTALGPAKEADNREQCEAVRAASGGPACAEAAGWPRARANPFFRS